MKGRTKVVAAGWLQVGGRVLTPEIEAAYFADEMARLREDIKNAEFRAKLFAAKQEKAPVMGTEAGPRWYRGRTDLDNQAIN